MLYSPRHKQLVRAYKDSYATINNNYQYHLPSSAKALAEHQQALLDLCRYLDSIGIHMPIINNK